MQKRYIKISLFGLGFLILAQMFDLGTSLNHLPSGIWLKFLPEISKNGLYILIPLLFGNLYHNKPIKLVTSFKLWLIVTITSIIYYIIYIFKLPDNFNAWELWGVVLPILTSTLPFISGIIFSLIAQPYIYKFQKHHSQKENLIILSTLSLLGFILSAGTYSLNYSIYALYLIIYFAWGMLLPTIKIDQKYLILMAIISFLIMFIGLPGFNSIHQYTNQNWNPSFLANVTSPILIGFVFSLYLLLNLKFNDKMLSYLIILTIFWESPNTNSLINAFKPTNSAGFNKLIIIISFLIVGYFFNELINKYLPPIKILNTTNVYNVAITIYQFIFNWIKKHKVNLLTLIWLYILSFCSFLIETDHLHVQVTTATKINAIIYIIGNKFFAVILTTFFLTALFSIFYFISNKYWLSVILTTAITIGWAIANKIKLNLRGEPIYPSDLNEATNIKTLIPMIGKEKVLFISISLILLLGLAIFLDTKFKYKTSLKKRSIWALGSILLLLTPLRFNHTNSIIYHLSQGFDNKTSFINPERDIQINGPVINFLSYLDLQIMNKPNNYNQNTLDHINDKYKQIANKINKTRKNKFNKQTIVFNLSESFVDPHTFPTIKIDKTVPNPVNFIQSLEPKATYGNMLSAGYGGGTANMEWESLTGLNMGLFKSTITPYVQVVPHYTFYPTIGMNFKYSSAIHPFIGSYYSRVEDYNRFKFNKFAYVGSKYQIVNQTKLGTSTYNSDETAYTNGLNQINSRKSGQFINLISIQNHMPYNDWYPDNEYKGKISGQLFDNDDIKNQMATYVKGVQYTDHAVEHFINEIDKIKKPITIVFYGDHYPSILPMNYTEHYPINLHSTRYFIYSNKYAQQHGAKAKLTQNTNYVTTNDFIAMALEQTNSKVTPYQALLTEIHKKLPALTINYKGDKGFELVDQNGHFVSFNTLTSDQKALLEDYKTVQYDVTAGKAYGLESKGFYNDN